MKQGFWKSFRHLRSLTDWVWEVLWTLCWRHGRPGLCVWGDHPETKRNETILVHFGTSSATIEDKWQMFSSASFIIPLKKYEQTNWLFPLFTSSWADSPAIKSLGPDGRHTYTFPDSRQSYSAELLLSISSNSDIVERTTERLPWKTRDQQIHAAINMGSGDNDRQRQRERTGLNSGAVMNLRLTC